MLIIVFVFVTWSCCFSECARILGIAAFPSYSHQVAYRPLWKELSLKGHDVTLITTDPMNDSSLINLKQINIHKETYPVLRSSKLIESLQMQSIYHQLFPFASFKIYADLIYELTKVIMEQTEVVKLLEDDTTFDLVITEPVVFIGFSFADKYKSKLIFITSMEAFTSVHRVMGNHVHPIAYSETTLPFTAKTYWNKIVITIHYFFHYIFRPVHLAENTKLLRTYFGESMSPLNKIADNASMLFINVNPIFGRVRPITPSTIYYGGGSHLEPEKPLPGDLKDFLDGARNGAIYFSLGTNVLSKNLPEEKKKVLLDTFRELPFRFLWKFEDQSLKNLPENVKFADWVSQQDILRHPNVKAFITQGGLQSIEEAVFFHIPIIGMPQIADQFLNIEKVVELGMGVQADFENLNIEDLTRNINDVVTNTSYRENMKKFIELSIDKPMTGLEQIIWWTEYVLRHNNTEHLKGPSRKMPLYQYLLLDVLPVILFFIVFLPLMALYLMWVLITFFCILCMRFRSRTKQRRRRPHKD